jgi:DNA-binding response OmpR family regulator
LLRYRALVVEADARLRFLMTKAFEYAGFKVAAAGDEPTAQAHLGHELPDLLIVDSASIGHLMTAMLRSVRQQPGGQRMTIIMVVDKAVTGPLVDADTVDLFLVKPISTKELTTLAQRVAYSMTSTKPDGQDIRDAIKKANPGLTRAIGDTPPGK